MIEPKKRMAIATLRDVWPAVRQRPEDPQELLDEVRRLYASLRQAPLDAQPAIEDQIRALAEQYKATAAGQATTSDGPG